MIIYVVMVAVLICVATTIGWVATMVNGENQVAEDRLSNLTGKSKGGRGEVAATSLLGSVMDEGSGFADKLLAKMGNFGKLTQQANLKISATKFLTICIMSGAVAGVVCLLTPTPKFLLPLFVIAGAGGPVMWLLFKRKKRIHKFNKQLPEVMELLSRSLRSGHSLGSGLGLIATEMPDPAGTEFRKAYDEQNLGISLEEALEGMTDRMPSMDLRFFATAVNLQRSTGGDLAEILDKIGHLVRERFKLAGTIQALTGEGRLSGIVLLALPPGLFVVMYYLNREYAMVLFDDPAGRKLLGLALVMQILGAITIKKIIDVKV